jgi:hypothetical protein
VRERLGHAGFVLREPGGGAALEARPRQFKLTRFGLVETWCVLEFPLVVDASSGSLVHLDKTPLWGAAYYRRTRAEGRELFSP